MQTSPTIMILSVVMVACLLTVTHASPLKDKRLGKREAEALQFGNHQNKASSGMPDVQLTNTYLGPQKRAQLFKDSEDERNDLESGEEEEVRKKKQSSDELDEFAPNYLNLYQKLLNEEEASPILTPEETYTYLNELQRRRRASYPPLELAKRFVAKRQYVPMALSRRPNPLTKAHRKKRPMPFNHKRSKRRSASYGMVNPAVLEEVLKAAAAEELLEQMENMEPDDDDYLENYEFKYPYYPGMMNGDEEYGSSQDEDDDDEEEDEEDDSFSESDEDEEEPPPQWLENFPQMVRRQEDKKRYTFPIIPLPGQKKKKDQIDSPYWGKIEDKKRAMKKRQQDAEELYSLAELLDEAQRPANSFYIPVQRRMVL